MTATLPANAAPARPNSDGLKNAAATRAASFVSSGMRIGIGTGSTAAYLIAGLGERVRKGLDIVAIPTSEATRRAAEVAGIPLATLDEAPDLDLTIDGADELDGSLRLIKGGGGALLREKIVAAASRRMIVIADETKRVDVLGRFPLPIEVVPFGLTSTRRLLNSAFERSGCSGPLRLRSAANGEPFVTDGGHWIIDAELGRIPDPAATADALASIPGVVEHGLFLGLATAAIVAVRRGDGVDLIEIGQL